MLHESASTPKQTPEGREERRRRVLQALRDDPALERLADALVDLPDDRAFGAIEYTLRDLSHDLAARAHQAGLDAGKKRATKVPAPSARTARRTHASSATAPNPS